MGNDEHARANAAGWMETIRELVAALECDYDRLVELRDEKESLQAAVKSAKEALHDESANVSDAEYERNAEASIDADSALNDWLEENGDELAALEAAATYEGDEMTQESARERIQESPLSVEVRSDWYAPGTEPGPPGEFCILLTTGGPALRIMGDLNEHGEPTRAWLQYQDWGTPWTDYIEPGNSDALLTFCQQFYFGD